MHNRKQLLVGGGGAGMSEARPSGARLSRGADAGPVVYDSSPYIAAGVVAGATDAFAAVAGAARAAA
ncbi:hypothetical protein MRX96_003658 [Rhipicephalus microplus]